MNEWIRPEEQLPKMEQTVIIADGKRSWLALRYNGIAADNPNLWVYGRKYDKVLTVKYWMPNAGALPPLPEEGE